MARLSVSLLGPLLVTLDDGIIVDFATDKARALLAYLIVESDRPHRRDALAGLLWPEQSRRKARQNLRQTLARARQVIGDDRDSAAPFLLVSRETIQFNTASDHWLDVAAFTSLAQACQGHRHRRQGTCLPCMRRMAQMAELYRGDFLDQFFLADSEAFEEWALLTREGLRREVVEALAHLARYHERRGEVSPARAYAWRQVELDPWREESHRHLMRLLALDGQRSAALAQYAACRHALAQELGVEPDAETTSLYERIRAGESLLLPAPGHNLPSLPSPFVGREEELADLAELLADPDWRLLSLVGPGGIGKTRLALQAAQGQVGAFADGIYFASLAPVSAAEFLLPTLANALGYSFQGRQDPQAQLLSYLREKDLLLVLDNLEHILEGTTLLAQILQHAPGVALLVTSRERLNLQEEWVYEVRGLRTPGDETVEDAETCSAVESVPPDRQPGAAGPGAGRVRDSLRGANLPVGRGHATGHRVGRRRNGSVFFARYCPGHRAQSRHSIDRYAERTRTAPQRAGDVRAFLEPARRTRTPGIRQAVRLSRWVRKASGTTGGRGLPGCSDDADTQVAVAL